MTDQKPTDNPFIERPDEHAPGNDLYCWLPGNSNRPCSGECVAYDASFAEDQRKSSCHVLNSIRSSAFSLAMLQKVMTSTKDKEGSKRMAEQIKTLTGPIPEVR